MFIHYLYSYLILPVSQGGFYGARNVDGKLFIGDTSLIKYMPKHTKNTSNRNKIIFICETYKVFTILLTVIGSNHI